MSNNIAQRYRYSIILLRQLVKVDFKLRYQGSVLGYMWSLLKPLFLFAILYTVFVKIVKINYGTPHSSVYLLLGIVIWTFFSEITGGSVVSVVSKGDLIRKLNFPKYVIVLATAFSALINLLLNLLVIALFIMLEKTSLSWTMLFVPALLLELFVFSLGIGFFLSAAFVRLRDLGHIWDLVLTALFYATPILFPITQAPPALQKILILNPIAQVIQDLRYIVVSKDVATITDVYAGNQFARIIPVSIVVVVVIVSALFFKKKSKYFAEDI